MKKNAFKDLGTKVKDPEQFVGRKDELQLIVDRIQNENFLIVGLPRIGKSSLAYQSLNKFIDTWRNEHIEPIVGIWFDVSQVHTPKEFFNHLTRYVYENALPYIADEDQKEKLTSYYKNAIKGKVDTCNITTFFGKIDESNIRINIVFDEFDVVKDFLKKNHFGCLHSILDNSKNIRVIITSRRFLENIEKEVCKTANPSVLFQIFTNITLKPFSSNEMDEYWKRIEPFLVENGVNLNQEYKEMAFWYSGHVPFFVDVFNDFYLRRKTDTEEFLYKFDTIFHGMVNILEDQEMLNPVLQVVVGPYYDCTEDQIRDLKRYGFIRKVSLEDKKAITNSEMGYISDKKECYVCMSDYFTRRLKSHYKIEAPFWEEWGKTLFLLRKLLVDYFIQNFGKEWESCNLVPYISEMQSYKNKDIREGIPVSDSLIYYLQERELLRVFQLGWDVFRNLFQDEYPDFNDKINDILYIRNHHAHINLNGLQKRDDILKHRKSICIEIAEKIETGYKNKELNLKDERYRNVDLSNLSNTPYYGKVEEDACGIYHIGPFAISKSYVDNNNMLGRQVYVTVAQLNTSNNGYQYFALRTS